MNVTIMSYGPVQFQIHPMNIDRYDHFTGSDFARKDVLETTPRREWVGEKDEEITVHGRVFPMNMKNAFGHLEVLEQTRAAGLSHALVRGGGNYMQALGWFVIEDLRRGHEHLSADGIGRVIEFQAKFARVDIPRGQDYYNSIFAITQGS